VGALVATIPMGIVGIVGYSGDDDNQ